MIYLTKPTPPARVTADTVAELRRAARLVHREKYVMGFWFAVENHEAPRELIDAGAVVIPRCTWKKRAGMLRKEAGL